MVDVYNLGWKAYLEARETDDALAHHGVLESGIHLIEKPFRPEALLSKVREVLT